MAENRRTSIAPGLDVVKWSVEGIDLDLSRSNLIDPLMPAKIAFEFLALCGGEAVCTHDWPLPEIRRILRTGTHWDNRILRVERLHAGDAGRFMEFATETIRSTPRYRYGCSVVWRNASIFRACMLSDGVVPTPTG